MLNGRSRVPYPCRWFVDVVRQVNTRVGGQIVPSCEPLVVYSTVPANISMNLARQESNLGKATATGLNSNKEYLVGLGGMYALGNIIQGDMIRVYWGTPPNLSSPVGVPVGYGEVIILSVGGSNVYLNWTNNGWSGGGYSITYGTSWELFSGQTKLADFGTDRDNPKITCGDFPDGISLLRVSGVPINLKILQVDHKFDDFGYWHHTSLVTEYADTDGRKRL